MDPITAGLFVGAGLYTSLMGNKNQARVQAAQSKLEVAQTKLQASEAALERTKGYRQNAAASLALSGMGFGSTTAMGLSAAQSFGNYAADIAALQMQTKFAEAGGKAKIASTKAARFSNDIAAVDNATSLATKLGLFSSKRKK